jgi:probable rRNA maturation factor
MIVNRQTLVTIPLRDLDEFLTRARRRLRVPKGALTICLVTNAEVARWNRAYRGKKGPTDVLSFPTNASAPKSKRRATRTSVHRSARFSSSPSAAHEQKKYLGDIAIVPAVAKRNARRFGRTFADEMRILILHGILHLMGYDHETDEGQMDRREARLRRELRLV